MSTNLWPASAIQSRSRVIIDNDFAGDPDGLLQLAHHVLSPSVDISTVIASAHNAMGNDDFAKNMIANAVATTNKVLELCDRTDIPVVGGSLESLTDNKTPIDNAAARAIINEAMREDTNLPLFVACGAGLTALASAWLIEPRIAERLTLVWIGGHEHPGMTPPAPGATDMEYNLSIDPIAGQIIFNESNIPIWQVPRDMYRSAIATRAELIVRLKPLGELGSYLYDSLAKILELAKKFGFGSMGEIYVLGDSPLVLLTALQTAFEPDPASSPSVTIPCPIILDSGLYQDNPNGRPIRVFTQIDNRTMFEDMYAKFAMHAIGEK